MDNFCVSYKQKVTDQVGVFISHEICVRINATNTYWQIKTFFDL